MPKNHELETYFTRSYDGPWMLKNNPLCLVVSMETCNSFIIAMDYKWVSITGLSVSVLSHCCHNNLSSTNTARHSPCLYTSSCPTPLCMPFKVLMFVAQSNFPASCHSHPARHISFVRLLLCDL